MNVGDVIVIASDLDDPNSMREYKISKVMKDTVQCGSQEDTFYTAFCWPVRAKEELKRIIQIRQGLKQAHDESMKLIYELKNRISRGEL